MRERRHVTLIRPVGEEQRFLAYLPLHGTKRLGRPLATTLAELGLWHRAEEDNNDPAPEPVPRYAEPSAFMPVHETLSRTLLSLSAHQILALRKNPRVLHLETGIRVLKSLPAH